VAGLALAFSVDSILNFIILWVVLHTELEDMGEKKIIISAVKFSIAAIACGLAVQGTKGVIAPLVDMNKFWGIFAQGAIAGVFGLVVYLAVCSLLRSEELMDFWNSFKRRLAWKKVEAGDQGEARGI